MADSDAGWLDVSSTETRVTYTAEADQTVFTVPFTFLDETHLLVTVNDTTQALSTDYATSGEGDEAGGSITFTTGLSAADSVVISLDVPYELQTHIPPSGQLDIPAINLQFSLFVMMVKQLAANLPRSVRQPESDVDDLSALPVAADRASKYLAFDADGDVTALASVSTSAAATAFWTTVLSTGDDAAESRSLLGITDQSSYTGLSNWNFCR